MRANLISIVLYVALYIAIYNPILKAESKCCCGGGGSSSSGGSSSNARGSSVPERNKKKNYKDGPTKARIGTANNIAKIIGKTAGKDAGKLLSSLFHMVYAKVSNSLRGMKRSLSRRPTYQIAQSWVRTLVQSQLVGVGIPGEWGEEAYKSASAINILPLDDEENLNPLSLEISLQDHIEHKYVDEFLTEVLFFLELQVGDRLDSYYKLKNPDEKEQLLKDNISEITSAFYQAIHTFYHYTLMKENVVNGIEENMTLSLWGNLYTLVKIPDCPLGAYLTVEFLSASLNRGTSVEELLEIVEKYQVSTELMNDECPAFKENMLVYLENPEMAPGSLMNYAREEARTYFETLNKDAVFKSVKNSMENLLLPLQDAIRREYESVKNRAENESEANIPDLSFESYQAQVKDDLMKLFNTFSIESLKAKEKEEMKKPDYNVPFKNLVYHETAGVKKCCQHKKRKEHKKKSEVIESRVKKIFLNRDMSKDD